MKPLKRNQKMPVSIHAPVKGRPPLAAAITAFMEFQSTPP